MRRSRRNTPPVGGRRVARRGRRSGSAAAAAAAVAALAVVAACGTADGPAADATPPEVEAEVVETGEAAAGALAKALVSELSAAMERGGPPAGIEICSARALALTDSIADEQPGVTALKRTSTRVRNPANAPDGLETEALAVFEAAEAAGQALPPHLVQRVDATTYRYYKPMTVAPLCVQCHGPREEIAPSVRAVLDDSYPGDEAVGYAAGDFRGLIRVAVPVSPVR